MLLLKPQVDRDTLSGGFKSVDELMEDLDNMLTTKVENVDEELVAASKISEPVVSTVFPHREETTQSGSNNNPGSHGAQYQPFTMSALP